MTIPLYRLGQIWPVEQRKGNNWIKRFMTECRDCGWKNSGFPYGTFGHARTALTNHWKIKHIDSWAMLHDQLKLFT